MRSTTCFSLFVALAALSTTACGDDSGDDGSCRCRGSIDGTAIDEACGASFCVGATRYSCGIAGATALGPCSGGEAGVDLGPVPPTPPTPPPPPTPPTPPPPPPPPMCSIAACEGGRAETCDHSLSLRCDVFGGACTDFVDGETGTPFRWCGCGSIAPGTGICPEGQTDGIVCVDGLATVAQCPRGSGCIVDATSPDGVACLCDNLADGVCLDGCTDDPDCSTCTPSCAGRSCGDNGCGGSCGTCGLGEACVDGACRASCVPACMGRECGDDGCGGECGRCGTGATCNASGICEGACTPDCAGRVCGSDGCRGSCGPCPAERECALDGLSCVCGFFETERYTFDASAIDWAQVNYVAIDVRHVGLDGTESTARGELLMGAAMSSVDLEFYGCEPDVIVSRTYSVRGGISCQREDERVTGRTSITIPAPIVSSDSCIAPAL